MNIHGREVGFKFTVGAQSKVASICPNGDLRKMKELLKCGDYVKSMDAIVTLIVALSEGCESAKIFENREYVPNPLTKEEVYSLTTEELKILQAEAMETVKNDGKPKIELEAQKKRAEA